MDANTWSSPPAATTNWADTMAMRTWHLLCRSRSNSKPDSSRPSWCDGRLIIHRGEDFLGDAVVFVQGDHGMGPFAGGIKLVGQRKINAAHQGQFDDGLLAPLRLRQIAEESLAAGEPAVRVEQGIGILAVSEH